MADFPVTSTIIGLAGHAADLTSKLYAIQGRCGHTSGDVESVANEIAMLAATLWRLHEAVAEDPNRYTKSFNHDLAEITLELEMVFEEISECCDELQKADPMSGNPVSWMFKKSKVHHLQKHLAALKTTLVVMRAVLNHGKEYGKQDSPVPVGSQPHTMHEDRAILDSVFAANRNAIIDLHNLEPSPGGLRRPANKNDQHEDTIATGTEVPPGPLILSAPTRTASGPPNTNPRRSFSRRGMRLGVHMSILDMGAHSAPDALKDKWIQTSRSHHPVKPTMTGARGPDKTHARFPLEESPTKANVSGERKTLTSPNHDRKTSRGRIATPATGMLHRMIDHLELSHSKGMSKLVPHGRRRSSVSKHPTPGILKAEGLRQHRFSVATKQEGAVPSRAREKQVEE